MACGETQVGPRTQLEKSLVFSQNTETHQQSRVRFGKGPGPSSGWGGADMTTVVKKDIIGK